LATLMKHLLSSRSRVVLSFMTWICRKIFIFIF